MKDSSLFSANNRFRTSNKDQTMGTNEPSLAVASEIHYVDFISLTIWSLAVLVNTNYTI
jgi:hypothetical protein